MPKPPSLIPALTLPCLGLSLLFCFVARPLPGPVGLSSSDTGETRQPKPAACNKSRLILLRCQYGDCERCRRRVRLSRSDCEAAGWGKKTREAIRLYNQVADDTDPSAFALTTLPRHLSPD